MSEPPVDGLLSLHEGIERQLAEILGGIPQSGRRPPIVIGEQSYEALPTFLLDPCIVRHVLQLAEAVDGYDDELQAEVPDSWVKMTFEDLAKAVMTKAAVARLKEMATTRAAQLAALHDLVVIVGRMREKGVV